MRRGTIAINKDDNDMSISKTSTPVLKADIYCDSADIAPAFAFGDTSK